jgi:hypothetical protein
MVTDYILGWKLVSRTGQAITLGGVNSAVDGETG